jgi:hypothetical protein
MSRIKHAAGLSLVVALAVPLALWGQPSKPLSKADVVKLIELQIDDDAIVARIEKGGTVGFKLDEVTEKELRGIGASDLVIRALRGTPDDKPAGLPDDPARETIAVWVHQQYSNDCPLVSELRVNDKLVEEFSSTSQRAIGKHLKMGWNTLTLKTKARPEVKEWNYLDFDIGPTRKDAQSGKVVMSPVVWSFTNKSDWSEQNKVVKHRLGPDVKEVTLTFRLYFAGLKHEAASVKAGAFILNHNQSYHETPPVTSTVFVNGTALTTFLGTKRNTVVVTPLLKKGKNEVRLVSSRIPNALDNNAVSFHVGGPAEYNATNSKFEFSPVLNFRSTDGWVQDKKSGQWGVEGKPELTSADRTFTFMLDADPAGK